MSCAGRLRLRLA